MSTLFTRRHYKWLVDMCIDLNLSNIQVHKLSNLLEETNSNYDANKFVYSWGKKSNE
jgi:hypothetical protein